MINDILSHPDITFFKVLNNYKRHTDFTMDITYKLEDLHRFRPIICNYKSNKNINYINYVSHLYKISNEKSIYYLKQFGGNVYYTILFLDKDK